MTDPEARQSTPKRKVGRSPAYPYISVQKAIEKTLALQEQEGDYAAPVSSAASSWGYSPKSSGARQTLATLKYYGLIDVLGDGDTRKVKISDTARRILLDKREDDTEKRQLIRKVALNPIAHKTIHDEYPTGLASDASVTHFLVFEAGFNPAAAAELLTEFKETATYARLYEPDKDVDKNSEQNHNDDGPGSSPNVKIGDRIQWASQGIDQFANGGLVLGFSEDDQWIFTDQGTSGVPISEVRIMEQTPTSTPPAMPAHMAAALASKGSIPDVEVAAKSGSRKAVFPVEEGDVTLIFPERITSEGLQELGRYLDIFLKKEQKKKDAGS